LKSVTIVPLMGAYYRPPAQSIISNLKGGSTLILEAEPTNEYDKNAIKVLVASDEIPKERDEALDLMAQGYGFSIQEIRSRDRWHLGYLARDSAEKIKPLLGSVEKAELGFGSDDRAFVKVILELDKGKE
jgi:hypothetical protein